MAGYKLKRKTSNGTMVDVPLVATYDDAGNKISETYAKKNEVQSGGLFEIPYDLAGLRSNSEGVDFIINNIEKIKKGAYFNEGGYRSTTIKDVYSDSAYITITFDGGVGASDDYATRYFVQIKISNKQVTHYNDTYSVADFDTTNRLMVGRWTSDTNTTLTSSNVSATAANNGKGVGIKGGNFVAMDFATKTELADYLPLTGGTLTGNLKVGSSSIGTNGYIEGTWLRTSSTANLGSAPARYCVFDPSGWVYYRTKEEMIADLGISSSQSTSQIVTHYRFDSNNRFEYTPNCITRRTYLGATQNFTTLSGPPETTPASTRFILVPKAGQGDYYCELYYMDTSGKFIRFNSTVPQGSYKPQGGSQLFIEEIMPIT